MTQTNYAAWEIDTKDFSHKWDDLTKLKYFARYAVLAPSGHNTQPWRFSSTGQTLTLTADFSRRLPYSGIQANEPFVSLGACLETLNLAANGFGYEVTIDYPLSDDAIATIKLSQPTKADPSLLEAITHRVSNRASYDTAPLDQKVVKSFVHTNLASVSSYIISDRDDIDFIADCTVRATHTTMGDKQFRLELSKWVRNNLTRQHDGMPGFVQGIPTPVSLLAKHVIKNIDVSKDQAKKDSGRVLQSANLVIISVDNPNPAGLINGGRLYAQTCILAQQQQIATAGIGAAIIDPDTREEIAAKYKLAGKPIAIIRLGKTDQRAKHAPRWPFSKVYSGK